MALNLLSYAGSCTEHGRSAIEMEEGDIIEFDYRHHRLALLTQHGKEAVMAPVLEPALGCLVQRVDGFDTDQLGTFTRDIPRDGSQLEAARRKARIGMELAGLQVGLASEGSFGVDPVQGAMPWNVELVVLIDQRHGLELVGMAQGPALRGHVQTGEWAVLQAFAERHGFPEHRLVLRPQHQDDERLIKGIADWVSLRQAFDACVAQAPDRQVFAESDLRAFAHPGRMQRIREATRDLLQRLLSPCPACRRPGYWVSQRLPGLPCADCGQPTRVHLAEVWRCPACAFESTRPRTDQQFAEAQHCDYCNP